MCILDRKFVKRHVAKEAQEFAIQSHILKVFLVVGRH